jgi:uncharacterized membrane protein YhaH (DUF805 family)
MDWIIAPLKNYAAFSGRARRLEFWAFLAFVTILQAGGRYFDGLNAEVTPIALGMGIAELCITLVFLLPSVAVGVRRLHDSGRSGLWMLLGYGPLAMANLPIALDGSLDRVLSGALIMGGGALLIMMLLPGVNSQNRYGTDPRKRGG